MAAAFLHTLSCSAPLSPKDHHRRRTWRCCGGWWQARGVRSRDIHQGEHACLGQAWSQVEQGRSGRGFRLSACEVHEQATCQLCLPSCDW